jgi:hypothetical protein
LGHEEVEGAIRQIAKRDLSSVEEIAFETCVTMSKQIWAGFIDGQARLRLGSYTTHAFIDPSSSLALLHRASRRA